MSVKLLKDLNFTEIINGTNAVTEAGKDMLSNYRGYIYSNPVSCTVVNNFIKEASNFGFDTGLLSILESVTKFINENNISWKLATACESIVNNNSTYGYLAKIGVEQVEKLLEMKESDVVSYIRAGVLKGIQYIPEFRSICKEVFKTTIVEKHTPHYSIINPVSYVMIDENKQYFSVLGKTLLIENDLVSEAVCNDTKFIRMNQLLESFKGKDSALYLEYVSGLHDNCTFEIKENKLNIIKGENVETFDNVVSFNEHVNNISKIMPIREKMNFMKTTAIVSEVFESIDNVCVLDCTKILNSANGTVLAITEAKNNVNLTIFRSYNAGTSSNNYDYVIEALKYASKVSGVDMKHLYEERINEDCKKENPEESKMIKEQLEESKQAQMDIRKKQIAMLAEKYKNDPAKITMLNTIARELALLEA